MNHKSFDFVDTELLGNREYAKAFRQMAYAIGAGAGFLLLLPTLPDIKGEEYRINEMLWLYAAISGFFISYAIIMGATLKFVRGFLPTVQFTLNWMMVPSAAIWFVMEGYRIIKGG